MPKVIRRVARGDLAVNAYHHERHVVRVVFTKRLGSKTTSGDKVEFWDTCATCLVCDGEVRGSTEMFRHATKDDVALAVAEVTKMKNRLVLRRRVLVALVEEVNG